MEIRDWNTHVPLPGVEVGDIGPKMGYGSKDNGFLRLTQFRVPKVSLLAKYISVDAEGKVTRRGNPKVMYSSMMYMRSGIVGSSYYNLMKACVIGIRYSILRTQFKDSEGTEIPVIKYQMQKQKMYLLLSRALVMNAAFHSLEKKIAENDNRVASEDFSLLKEAHLDLCTHKAFFSEWLNYGYIETMRACGGHGFSILSGVANMLVDDFPYMILEGENSVLFL